MAGTRFKWHCVRRMEIRKPCYSWRTPLSLNDPAYPRGLKCTPTGHREFQARYCLLGFFSDSNMVVRVLLQGFHAAGIILAGKERAGADIFSRTCMLVAPPNQAERCLAEC